MRLRQIALIARDIDPVVADLCACLGIEVSFRDPGVAGFGLHNAVMPVGDTFLEVVSPLRPDTAGGRFLERHGGDGGYMVIIQCDDVDAARRRIADLGVRVVWSIDLADARCTHLHPRDVGGAILSVDSATPPSSWRWAGPDWEKRVRTEVVSEIAGVDIQSADPAGMARRWSEILDRPCRESADGGYEIALDRGVLRFVQAADGRGDGVCGFSVRVEDRERLLASARARGCATSGDAIQLCGVRIRLT